MNWPASEERIPGKLPGEAYILEVLNLEDIPDAYAFAIEKLIHGSEVKGAGNVRNQWRQGTVS